VGLEPFGAGAAAPPPANKVGPADGAVAPFGTLVYGGVVGLEPFGAL